MSTLTSRAIDSLDKINKTLIAGVNYISEVSHVLDAIEHLKGLNINVLDVRAQTPMMDFLVIVTGTSTRHVKAIADNVVKKAKEHKIMPVGIEGQKAAEWILVDLGGVVVHVMLKETRTFYALEKLWTVQTAT